MYTKPQTPYKRTHIVPNFAPHLHEIEAVWRSIRFMEPYQYEYSYGCSVISRLVAHMHKHDYYPDLSRYPRLAPPSWPTAIPRPRRVGNLPD